MESEADALTQIGTDELEGKVSCLRLSISMRTRIFPFEFGLRCKI